MAPSAVLFGSIGTLVETSEIQRESFNEAFRAAGLDWDWSRDDYLDMLRAPGGLKRIETYNRARGARIDAESIHREKTRLFQARLTGGVPLRPGVSRTIAALREEGVRLAFCSTTDAGTVDRILAGAAASLPEDAFDFVGSATAVANPKPAPDIYVAACKAMGVEIADAVAVEDSPESAAAAAEAGCRVVAFPGEAHAHREFPAAGRRIERMDPRALGFGFAPLAHAAE